MAETAVRSASTLLREQQDPAARLGAAAARYLDALHIAAEHLAGLQVVANLDRSAERLLDGLTGEPAWPRLRGHLLLLAAAGLPVAELYIDAVTRDLTGARDQAAAIDVRLQDVSEVAGVGPLPWLPGIPHRLAADPNWGPYLNARSQLVAELADQVHLNTSDEAPAWAAQRHASVPAELMADIQVWRAATQIDPSDLRPTGPRQLGSAARIFQQQLDMRLAVTDTRTERQWRQLVAAEAPSATRDPFLRELTERLNDLTQAGFDASQLLRSAAAAGPLPDDHPAAALWWRILDQLPQRRSQQPGTRNAVPATRRRAAPAPARRSAPPPAFGPSR